MGRSQSNRRDRSDGRLRGRSQPRPALRKAKDKPGDPDDYPVNSGLVKMSDRRSEYAPIRELKSLPREQN